MKAPAKPKASPDPKMAKKQKEAAEAAKKTKDEEKSKKERERKEKEDARLAKQEATQKKREEAETKKRADEEQRKEKDKAKKVYSPLFYGYRYRPVHSKFRLHIEHFRSGIAFHSKFRLEFHTEHNTLSDPTQHIHFFFVLLFTGKEDWCQLDGLHNELVGRTPQPSEAVSVISRFNPN